MSHEHNAPCPCGSGKKYKKCCGETGLQALPGTIRFQRAVAYKGKVGRRRESWCADYFAFKRENIAEVEKMLREDSLAAGRTISCHKGCTTCGCAYVVASLQECEIIVYWLYHHEDALRHFLSSYQVWRARIGEVEELFNRVYSFQDRALSRETTEGERIELLVALTDYMGRGIVCPFVAGGACSIYDVRPFVCAGVVATTPPEWCLQSHPRHAEVVLYKADAHFENDAPYFRELKNKVSYGCVPYMVYTLLQGGYETLSTIPGLEEIGHEVHGDPEVRAEVLKAGFKPDELI